jgi:DNA modification methylase
MEFKLYNENCIDVLNRISEKCIDLTITSPPYDNLREYKNDFDWNEKIWKNIIDLLYKVTKLGGVVVWVVNDATINGSETGSSFKQALYFKEIGFNLHDTMIYGKKFCKFPSQTRYYNVFEYMFIFSKGKPNTINLIKDRENKTAGYNRGRKKIRTKKENKFQRIKDGIVKPFGVRFNIWYYTNTGGNGTKDTIAYKHPAIMPDNLVKDHLISWSNENDTVLDPFMGSGTVGKISKMLNRNFLGIEIDPEYFNIAKERIENYNEVKIKTKDEIQESNDIQLNLF